LLTNADCPVQDLRTLILAVATVLPKLSGERDETADADLRELAVQESRYASRCPKTQRFFSRIMSGKLQLYDREPEYIAIVMGALNDTSACVCNHCLADKLQFKKILQTTVEYMRELDNSSGDDGWVDEPPLEACR